MNKIKHVWGAPWWFWLIPLVVSVLKALPFIYSYLVDVPAGQEVLHIAYNPKDFLTYFSYIRQYLDSGQLLWENKFLLQDQEPRFLFLFFLIISFVCEITGASIGFVLELSRVPLIFIFFKVLLWFLKPFYKEESKRYFCCLLVGFSGGVECYFKIVRDLFLNPVLAETVYDDTRHLLGWNSFNSFHNPLWVMAFILLMLVIKPALQPEGPQKKKEYWQIALGFLCLYFVHPYTAMMALAVLCAEPLLRLLLGKKVNWKKFKKIIMALSPTLIFCFFFSLWQRQDPVFVGSSKQVLGTQSLSVFWYPLTLGVLFVFCIRALRQQFIQKYEYRWVLLSWLLIGVVAHTSSLTNGYHFVPYLHLPLCIVSAPLLLKYLCEKKIWQKAVLLLLLFSSFVFVSYEAMEDVKLRNFYPQQYKVAIAYLETAEPGHVLCPPDFGSQVAAFSPHKVWVGHWALTPQYKLREKAYYQMISNYKNGQFRGFDLLKNIVDAKNVNYLVLPKKFSPQVVKVLGERVNQVESVDSLDILVLKVYKSNKTK